jgi:hypothetical protein
LGQDAVREAGERRRAGDPATDLADFRLLLSDAGA